MWGQTIVHAGGLRSAPRGRDHETTTVGERFVTVRSTRSPDAVKIIAGRRPVADRPARVSPGSARGCGADR